MGKCDVNGTNQTTFEMELSDKEPYFYAINLFVLLAVALTMLFNWLGCVSLFLSTRLVFHIRYVCLSFMLGMFGLGVFTSIIQVSVLINGVENALVQELRTILTCLFIAITWSSLAHLAINRVVFVTKGTAHWFFDSKVKVMITLVICNWLCPLAFVAAASVYLYDSCVFVQKYDFERSEAPVMRKLMSIPYLVYNGIAVTAYLVLWRFLRRLQRSRSAGRTSYEAARLVIRVTITSSILQSPYFLGSFLRDVVDIDMKFYSIVLALTSALILVSMLVNTYLCVWKLEECQYHFLRLYLSCFERYRQRAEQLRLARSNRA